MMKEREEEEDLIEGSEEDERASGTSMSANRGRKNRMPCLEVVQMRVW